MAILMNANQVIKQSILPWKDLREVEFTEIKQSELTSGKFSEPQAKRKKLKDEKYNEITLIMSYMEKLIEVNCK